MLIYKPNALNDLIMKQVRVTPLRLQLHQRETRRYPVSVPTTRCATTYHQEPTVGSYSPAIHSDLRDGFATQPLAQGNTTMESTLCTDDLARLDVEAQASQMREERWQAHGGLDQ